MDGSPKQNSFDILVFGSDEGCLSNQVPSVVFVVCFHAPDLLTLTCNFIACYAGLSGIKLCFLVALVLLSLLLDRKQSAS